MRRCGTLKKKKKEESRASFPVFLKVGQPTEVNGIPTYPMQVAQATLLPATRSKGHTVFLLFYIIYVLPLLAVQMTSSYILSLWFVKDRNTDLFPTER